MASLVTFTTTIGAGPTQLHSGQRCARATVEALAANTDKVYIGDGTSQVYELAQGESVDVFPNDLNQLYISGTQGDKVAVLAWL